MAGFRRRENALNAGKLLRRLEDLRLLDGARFHQTVVIELGKRGAHAVEAQAAGMNGRGHKAASQCIHFGKRAHLAGIAEVIGESAARKARAGSRLDRDDPVIRLAAQLLPHERRDQSAQVGAAAGTADDDVRLDAVFIQSGLRLKSDHTLVQQHLIEDAAEHITVALTVRRILDRFADRAAETASGPGEFG